MGALAISSAGILTGIAIVVVLIALGGSAIVWWSLRRSKGARARHEDGPVIDLAYLERAIKADEDATARRAAEARPLLSGSPSAPPHRLHRLPTNGHGR